NISALNFTLTTEARTYTFSSGAGFGGISQNIIANLPPNDCVQLVAFTAASNEPIPNDICSTRWGWVNPGPTALFWTSSAADAVEFEVFSLRRRIVACSLGEVICEFSTQRSLTPSSASATPTEPTATPTVTPSPTTDANATLRLVYSNTSFTILNI